MAKVSVIMPLYNCEVFITDQINSILNQTYSDFELLVVDDGCTDKTMSIIRAIKEGDSRIKIYPNEFQKGIAGSLNTGLQYAKGKYIARADGDDIHMPNRLELQVNYLEDNRDIHIIGGRSILFNEKGVIRETFYPLSSIELAWKFLSNTYFCHPSVMFRMEVYQSIGGYPYQATEDFAYFSTILKNYRGANLPQVLLKYRVHDKSYSHTDSNKIAKNVYDIYIRNYQFYGLNMKYSISFYKFHALEYVSLLLFPQLLIINTKLLNLIRKKYAISFLNSEFLKIIFAKQLKWLFKAHFNHLKIFFISIARKLNRPSLISY